MSGKNCYEKEKVYLNNQVHYKYMLNWLTKKKIFNKTAISK